MKNVLLILLWILSVPLFAQNTLFVSGTVNNINTGAPIPNHAVTIQTDSTAGVLINHVVYTNPNGFYSDVIPVNPQVNTGILIISTYDCQQYQIVYTQTFGQGVTSITQNFLICYNGDCHAEYSYAPAGPLTIQFTDASLSVNSLRTWDFGDGTSSTLVNPLHTFPAAGTYQVTLSVGAQGTTCWDQETKTVYVTDSTATGCQAAFTWISSSSNNHTVYFYDQSVTSGPVTWHWNFGDGTGSNEQNPVHTFPVNPVSIVYNVCLTITGANNTCSDMTCQPVIVGDSTGTCHAEFTYAQLPGATPNTLAFTDMSISPGPVSWFWEFGDGTASNEQNPVHVFPPNSAGVVYNVCLTITGVSSTNCTDTECEPVTVGPPPACEADFEHWPANVPMSIHFLDESFGNVVNWTWEFGDGTSQTIVSPGNPNVIHTYPSPGVYNACLYIVTEDSCTSLKCESIFVGDSIFGCNADFSYIVEQVPGSNFITVIFHDLSISTTPVSWFWDFGDGTTSTEQNPVHVYPAISLTPYTACLTITSVNGNCIDTKCELIEAGQIPGCEADFEVHPAPNSLLTIHFEDLSEGDIHFWTWEFGDGITQTITYPNNPNVFHTYATPGFYTACLYIQGPDSCYSSICKIVAVGDSVPDCQAQFSYFPEPSITNTGNTIHFLDMSLGNPTQWFWNFGDGTSSNLQNPIHTYGAPGTYYVCLTISGPSCQSVWCADVEVGQSNNCVSYFTYSNIGLAVNFEGHLLNPTGGTYYWDFGDNQVGIGQNVIHSYNAPGIYYVTLTTTSGPNASCTYTSGQSITVGDSTAWNQVYGQVFAGSFPATAGMVMLFSLDTNNFFVPFVDIAMIDSAGVYYFPMVPQGDFLIHAIPFEYGYLPTYYGDVLFWQDATVVTLGTANNPYDIHLIQAGSSGGGNGMISGQLIQGDISTALVDKVTMLLKDEGGTTIRSCQVNESGNFEFTQLAMGTYYLYGEIAGCESENIKVVLSETSPSSSLNLLLSGHSILGREDKEITLEAGMIYPNPAKDNARIAIRLNTSANLTINLNSSEGHRVYSQVESVGTGQTEILIPISQLASGIYSVQIRSDKGLLLTRKLVVIK